MTFTCKNNSEIKKLHYNITYNDDGNGGIVPIVAMVGLVLATGDCG